MSDTDNVLKRVVHDLKLAKQAKDRAKEIDKKKTAAAQRFPRTLIGRCSPRYFSTSAGKRSGKD